MKNKRFFIMLLVAESLLFVPLIAMQFTGEVVWTASDFIIMSLLLLFTTVFLEFGLRSTSNRRNRLLIILGILIVFFLIYAELAVGIFGSSFAGS